MKMDPKKIGYRIHELRKQNNMSMDALAKELNLAGKSTINNWERGRSVPNINTLNNLATFFNVDLNYLRYGTLKGYIIDLISSDLKSDDSLLNQAVQDFLSVYSSDYARFKNSSLILDENNNVLSPENYEQIILNKTQEEFITIFSNELYTTFINYLGKEFHYENDSNIIQKLIKFLKRETLYYSNTFIAKYNSIYNTLMNNFSMDYDGTYADKTLEEIKELYPNDITYDKALDIKYNDKLFNLETDFLMKLDQLFKEYKNKQ